MHLAIGVYTFGIILLWIKEAEDCNNHFTAHNFLFVYRRRHESTKREVLVDVETAPAITTTGHHDQRARYVIMFIDFIEWT